MINYDYEYDNMIKIWYIFSLLLYDIFMLPNKKCLVNSYIKKIKMSNVLFWFYNKDQF